MAEPQTLKAKALLESGREPEPGLGMRLLPRRPLHKLAATISGNGYVTHRISCADQGRRRGQKRTDGSKSNHTHTHTHVRGKFMRAREGEGPSAMSTGAGQRRQTEPNQAHRQTRKGQAHPRVRRRGGASPMPEATDAGARQKRDVQGPRAVARGCGVEGRRCTGAGASQKGQTEQREDTTKRECDALDNAENAHGEPWRTFRPFVGFTIYDRSFFVQRTHERITSRQLSAPSTHKMT